jgi:hypothetical protein
MIGKEIRCKKLLRVLILFVGLRKFQFFNSRLLTESDFGKSAGIGISTLPVAAH